MDGLTEAAAAKIKSKKPKDMIIRFITHSFPVKIFNSPKPKI